MNEDKSVYLTYCYGQSPQDVLGMVNLTPNVLWDVFKERPELFTFEPGYIKHEDGTVELTEISMVLKQRSPQGASMALSDIIDDLS